MKKIISFILFLSCAVSAASENAELFAEASTNIQYAYTPDSLLSPAITVGKIIGPKSVNLLEKILKKCDELDQAFSTKKYGNHTDIVRAYVMYYLARQSKRVFFAKKIIEDNFRLNRPVCFALYKAKFQDLYRLIDKEIVHLFANHKNIINDKTFIETVSQKHPGIRFITRSRVDTVKSIVDEELLDAMIDFAYIVETMRDPKYMNLCKKVLDNEGSYFWNKLIYRAILKMKTSNFNKFIVLKNEMNAARNTEKDKCEWNFNDPETIELSIKNISAEAYLVFAISHLKKIDLKERIDLILPSLKSSSFSARAMALDCLLSNKKTKRFVKNINDENLKKFAKVLLEE